MRQTLKIDDMRHLATGAWILGTGGGGSPYVPQLTMRAFYEGGGSVDLIDPEDLGDDDLVAVVSTMGAPLVFVERMTDPDFAMKPLRLMEAYLGRRFSAVMAIEVGGANSFQPLLIAAASGLPVVDADAMGRAYPMLQMTSFAIADLVNYPQVVADVRDNETLIGRAESWAWMEQIRRKICVEFGSIATTCQAPRTGAEIKAHAIHHTISKAIGLGREVFQARATHSDVIAAILEETGAKSLFAGKVVDVQRRTEGGYLRGTVRLQGMGEDRDGILDVAFQNEFTVAWRNGEVLVTTPDLICILERENGEAVGTESLRYGQRVSVLALPAPAIHRTGKGLAHVGPRAFGHELDFKTVFPLQGDMQ